MLRARSSSRAPSPRDRHRRGAGVRRTTRAGQTDRGHPLLGVPGRQLVARGRPRPAGARPQPAVALAHVDRRDLHPDFGPSYGDGPDYGIPITVVGTWHAKVRVRFDYAAESDQVRYPLGRDTRIEGGRGLGRRQARDRRRQGEAAGSTRPGTPGSGERPLARRLRRGLVAEEATTCARTAGPPPTPPGCRSCPGCCAGTRSRTGIDHAIRFTTDVVQPHHLWPARHDAGRNDSLAYPPMGARFRLSRLPRPVGLSAKAQSGHSPR